MRRNAFRTIARACFHSTLPDGAASGQASTIRQLLGDGSAIVCGAGTSLYACGTQVGLLAAAWWLVAVIVIRSDLTHFTIPDTAVATIVLLGLLRDALAPGPAFPNVLHGMATGGGAFVLFWLVGALYLRRTGRTGLGFGDVKLAGASAVWLSPGNMALAVEIAAIAAASSLLLRRVPGNVREIAVPFGAFLAPSAWLVFVAQPLINAVLENLS